MVVSITIELKSNNLSKILQKKLISSTSHVVQFHVLQLHAFSKLDIRMCIMISFVNNCKGKQVTN